MEMVKEKNYLVVNVDCTVCLQEPKLRSYIKQMQQVIAPILGMTEKDISIKATTTEKMGFIGKGNGLMAYATVLLNKAG